MAGMKRHKGLVVWTLLVAMLPFVMGGCYGRFPLLKRVYKFNGEVSDNKWIQTIVMWVFGILPVYGLSTFADLIVFNLWEFWTGEQLLAGTTTVSEDGTRVALQPGADENEVVLTVSRDGRAMGEAHFLRVSKDLIEVRDADGALQGKVIRAGEDSFLLTDKSGNTVRQVSASEVSRLAVN